MGISFEVKTIDEVVMQRGINILVHGMAGSGKTVLVGTIGERTLLLSVEGGLLSLKGNVETGLLPESVMTDIDVVEILTIDQLELIRDDVCHNQTDYKWIALDSISEIAENILLAAKKDCKDPRAAYGIMMDRVSKCLIDFRDLKNKNKLMTCKQQRTKDDDTGRTLYLPSMPGNKLHQSIPYIFDEVWALRVEKDEEGNDYRVLQTNRDAQYEAKDRSGKLDMFEEPNVCDIVQKIGMEVDYADWEEIEEVEEAEDDYEGEEYIAEGDMYWLHIESSKTMSTDAGDNVIELLEDEGIEEIDEETFTRLNEESSGEEKEEKEEAEEETVIEEDVEVIAEKKHYWVERETEKVMATEKGDDISELLSDDGISQINKLKYTKILEAGKKKIETVTLAESSDRPEVNRGAMDEWDDDIPF